MVSPDFWEVNWSLTRGENIVTPFSTFLTNFVGGGDFLLWLGVVFPTVWGKFAILLNNRFFGLDSFLFRNLELWLSLVWGMFWTDCILWIFDLGCLFSIFSYILLILWLSWEPFDDFLSKILWYLLILASFIFENSFWGPTSMALADFWWLLYPSEGPVGEVDWWNIDL